ncbi:MAG TPA: Stp1/IreP family PP2C-type Ser/Thr phosphatase [Gaiellaceae bacterium]|nr:Stp1/IreP family PP2C-type Ser/Thr phosphatase [Gaiellaceae bacterium]
MRVAESAGLTDPGRKRRRNEDSYVIDPPLFAVADGMGGAQAGEVASRLAAAAFREFHGADDLDHEKRLAAIIQEANRRIYERASDDAQTSGMGTTITAALVGDDSLAIGHVGDSRAYRLRGGRFEQLTDDHSLVADLVRSGRLTPEEADAHPQRSVITRVLGTDAEVDIDTFSVGVETGDLFLLCSDGLTTMVADEEIRRLVAGARDLDQAGKTLVKAANRAGGEDNVTVVLFRLTDGRSELEDTVVAAGNGRAHDDDLEDTLTGLEAPTIAAPAPTAVLEREAEWGPAIDEPPPERRPGAGRESRWGRRAILTTLGLAFVAVIVALALWGLSRANFIGVDDDGNVAVYQGVPWDLGAGIHLYRARYVSRLQAVQLSQAERESLLGHDLTSYDTARDRLAPYEEAASP